MKKKSILIGLLIEFFVIVSYASVYQWSVPINSVVSGETNGHPRAFLWIPEDCQQVRAVVFGQHNMCEEPIFDHPVFRKAMAELGFAIVWMTPGIDQQWDVKTGCQQAFDTMMEDLADVSGYSELKYAPVVPFGHSAMGTFPWTFAAWNPERTLAIISYKGDAPRTNLTGYGRENIEWGRTRNIDGIPGLIIKGEYEWWEARVNPALAFRMMYPESCISFLCDAGRGHFDVSDEVVDYLCLFLKKAAQYRLPGLQPLDALAQLKKLNLRNGWLAERWYPNQKKRARTAPFSGYKGDPHDAFWYFDGEMAKATEAYYARERGKRDQHIGFLQNGNLLAYNENLHARTNGRFEPEADGLTFHLKAEFTDSLRLVCTHDHSSVKPVINRICGPVEKLNDTTFTVRFYRVGLNNSRRTGDIWLLASHNGDDEYKSSVQQIEIRIPHMNMEGIEQQIIFEHLPNVNTRIKELPLNASASSGMQVQFYVREGPVQVKNGKLIFTRIPPRSKFPVKVTLVAWQYGRSAEPKVQTAEPVVQSFWIVD